MRFDIRIQKLDLHQEVSRYIERRLRLSLSRLVSRLRTVNVRVFDVNGPRGGIDKCCRITAHLLPSETVVLQEVDADLFAAIDRATRRISRTFTRRLTLERDLIKRAIRRAQIRSTPAKRVSPEPNMPIRSRGFDRARWLRRTRFSRVQKEHRTWQS